MNNWWICWFFTHILMGILIFKWLTARRLYKSFGIKGLRSRAWLCETKMCQLGVQHCWFSSTFLTPYLVRVYILCMFRSLYSVYCLCVNVYCSTATGFQSNCSYIYIYIVLYYLFILLSLIWLDGHTLTNLPLNYIF
jgi:hypothetical protein